MQSAHACTHLQPLYRANKQSLAFAVHPWVAYAQRVHALLHYSVRVENSSALVQHSKGVFSASIDDLCRFHQAEVWIGWVNRCLALSWQGGTVHIVKHDDWQIAGVLHGYSFVRRITDCASDKQERLTNLPR